MDEFWRFSKLRKVNIWYIREKGVFRKVLVVWNKIWKELDWGGQDALNTCENSFLDLIWALEGKKTWSDLDKPLM